MSRNLHRLAIAAAMSVASLVPAARVSAQNFTERCAIASGSSSIRQYCERIALAVEIAEPRFGIAMTGGNPVYGTASTLGMRIGTIPRVSFGVRATAATVDLPPIESASTSEDIKFAAPSLDLDASVGIFSGLSVFPTVGGFGSVDFLASVGTVPLPEGKGFSESPMTWGLGARVGVIRESFTAPGISVSAMYRRLGDASYGDTTFQKRDAYFAVKNLSVWSYRAAISKRVPLVGLGATAGIGIDRSSSDVRIGINNAIPFLASDLFITAEDLKTTRKTAFVNASWTLLLLNIAGEAGWQEGGKADPNATISTARLEKAGYYAGVAVRIAL
jgi:hypothetical protein